MFSTLLLVIPISVASGCGCSLSAVNQWLLTKPGHFEVSVDTSPYPETVPGDPLTFPVADLEKALRENLRQASVPIEGEAPRPGVSRALVLSVQVWKEGGKYSYWLALTLGDLPDDPKGVIYDDIWPIETGSTKASKLRQELMKATSAIAKRFAALYSQAKKSKVATVRHNNALERTRRVGVPASRAVVGVSPRRSTQCSAGCRVSK